MKALLCTLMLAALGTAMAKADPITITFDQPNQTVSAGGTVAFWGKITNNTGSAIFLNGDALNVDGLSLTATDWFYTNAPISVDAGQMSVDVELFDISASSPLLDALGTYSGRYTVIGGADGDAQDNLSIAGFSITTVPEPSSIVLMISGLSGALVPISRRLRSRA